MKKTILALATLCQTNNLLLAQQNQSVENYKNSISIGVNINNFGQDFGIGINVTTPHFFNGHAAIRASENYQWLNHLDKNGKYTWTGYHMVRIGAAGINVALTNSIKLYGEGGVSLLLANNMITSKPTSIGGYGLFGFEFLTKRHISYFIELGGIGSGATADKVTASPIYSNGFLASTGLRVNL